MTERWLVSRGYVTRLFYLGSFTRRKKSAKNFFLFSIESHKRGKEEKKIILIRM